MMEKHTPVVVRKLDEGSEFSLVALAGWEIFLEVDLNTGTVTVDTSEKYTPESVYHGRVRRYHIADPISVSAANMLLEDDEVLRLAQRMVDGARIERDDRGNLRGRLDEDGGDAEDDLDRYIEKYEWLPSDLVSQSTTTPVAP